MKEENDRRPNEKLDQKVAVSCGVHWCHFAAASDFCEPDVAEIGDAGPSALLPQWINNREKCTDPMPEYCKKKKKMFEVVLFNGNIYDKIRHFIHKLHFHWRRFKCKCHQKMRSKKEAHIKPTEHLKLAHFCPHLLFFFFHSLLVLSFPLGDSVFISCEFIYIFIIFLFRSLSVVRLLASCSVPHFEWIRCTPQIRSVRNNTAIVKIVDRIDNILIVIVFCKCRTRYRCTLLRSERRSSARKKGAAHKKQCRLIPSVHRWRFFWPPGRPIAEAWMRTHFADIVQHILTTIQMIVHNLAVKWNCITIRFAI